MRTEHYFDSEMSQCEKDPSRALSWFQIYTRVKVGKISCSMMIDRSSKINLASQTLVDALKLVVTEHPDPYKLAWHGKYVIIKHQVEVPLGFCGFSDSILCDVLPSLLLTSTNARALQQEKNEKTYPYKKAMYIYEAFQLN